MPTRPLLLHGTRIPPCLLAKAELQRQLFDVEESEANRSFIASESAAARLLADDGYRNVVMQFVGRARTLAEVAGSSPSAIKKLHHQLRRLCAAGLIEIVGARARGGRPMKLYRAVADSFFVPNELLPAPFTQGLSAELRESHLRHGFQSGAGMRFGIGPDGQQAVTRVEPNAGAAAIIDLWVVASLTPSDAARLKEDLRTVILGYRDADKPGARPYLIHAAAAPRLSDGD